MFTGGCIRIEVLSDFKDNDVVLFAMTGEGVALLLQALLSVSEAREQESAFQVGDERLSVRVTDSPTTLRREAGVLRWTLSETKLKEVTDKLESLRTASGPGHHYVDISEPVGTLFLSKDEYIQR